MDEKDFIEMDDALRQAQDEQARINAVMKETGDAMNAIALKYYPRLGAIESDAIRKYADLLSRASCNFAMDLDHLAGSTI